MVIQPVILAGGTGSRLWPLSRELYPKQLLNLIGSRSLLQTTLERVSELQDTLPPIVVVGEEHRFLTKTQVDGIAIDLCSTDTNQGSTTGVAGDGCTLRKVVSTCSEAWIV